MFRAECRLSNVGGAAETLDCRLALVQKLLLDTQVMEGNRQRTEINIRSRSARLRNAVLDEIQSAHYML